MATATISAVGAASSKSSPAPARRFRIGDAMILVAATAVACGLMLGIERITEGQISWRAFRDLVTAKQLASLSTGETVQLAITGTFLAILLALPFVAMWTLAVIPIRLLGARPRFRRLTRQPGIIAALAAALALILAGIPFGLVFWLDANDNEIILLLAVPTYPGLAVLVSWMTLLVGRRWRRAELGRSTGSGSRRFLDRRRALHNRRFTRRRCILIAGYRSASRASQTTDESGAPGFVAETSCVATHGPPHQRRMPRPRRATLSRPDRLSRAK